MKALIIFFCVAMFEANSVNIREMKRGANSSLPMSLRHWRLNGVVLVDPIREHIHAIRVKKSAADYKIVTNVNDIGEGEGTF